MISAATSTTTPTTTTTTGTTATHDVDDRVATVLDEFAGHFIASLRAPVLHHPSEYGMAAETVTFPASDGVPLEGWFIPAEGSDKIVIANHPMTFSRSGQPTHREPWLSMWGSSGNTMEVDFVQDYRILHDAGYNVLAYDLRNHGLSGAAHGGILGSGLLEARDVLGSLKYVRERAGTPSMTIGLFSRCLGANSTFAAMTQQPRAFDGVRCLVAPQPVTTGIILQHQLELAGVSRNHISSLDERLVLRTGISLAERDAREWAKNVTMPTFVYQVRDDILTEPEDVQTMFDNIPLDDKKLHWVEGTTVRWDGYLEFQRRPEPMLAWFREHMG
ncbi:alpha/beta hydrolase [Streptomyces sp. NPDC058653]|uniref:alpha/beta hydrolase n=1 Tax=Streptomyces sp. NPDC058653 TaxID=3346576 RepID=UPI00364F8765